MTRNPPLGAPWLTPRLEARLRDLERRLIRARGRMFGERHALEVCGDATREAFDLIVDASGLSGDLVFGIVFHTGVPGGWPNVDQAKLVRPYGHWWIELEDGTIVDVASSQFGHRSPLVIPPGHPMQRLYVPEDPNADELPSGYLPLLVDRHRRRANPDTPFVEFASELPGFLDSDEALAALEGMPTNGGNPWLHGGCFILTEALQDFLGRNAVALDVESHGLDLHSVIEVHGSFGTVWIDGRGAYDPGLARSLFPGMASVELHGRMADEGRVRRLLDALKARFGSVQIPA